MILMVVETQYNNYNGNATRYVCVCVRQCVRSPSIISCWDSGPTHWKEGPSAAGSYEEVWSAAAAVELVWLCETHKGSPDDFVTEKVWGLYNIQKKKQQPHKGVEGECQMKTMCFLVE